MWARARIRKGESTRRYGCESKGGTIVVDGKKWVGIDVAKDSLEVYVRPLNESFSVSNTPEGLEELVARLKPLAPERVVLEATGKLEILALVTLAQAGLPVVRVNPRRARDFARSIGRIAKTDSIDAGDLAHYAEAIRPETRAIPEDDVRDLESLMVRRRQVVEMITAEKNRLGRARESVQTHIKDHIAWLEDQRRDLEKQIELVVSNSSIWREQDKVMRSVKGVGPVFSHTIAAWLPEIGTLSGKEISALVGVAPMNRDSGLMRGKRSICGGRAEVRSVLYMATVVAVTHNPIIRQFYERLTRAGKPPKVAITACAHKLLVILNAMVRDQSPWRDPATA
jgi:transposase